MQILTLLPKLILSRTFWKAWPHLEPEESWGGQRWGLMMSSAGGLWHCTTSCCSFWRYQHIIWHRTCSDIYLWLFWSFIVEHVLRNILYIKYIFNIFINFCNFFNFFYFYNNLWIVPFKKMPDVRLYSEVFNHLSWKSPFQVYKLNQVKQVKQLIWTNFGNKKLLNPARHCPSGLALGHTAVWCILGLYSCFWTNTLHNTSAWP